MNDGYVLILPFWCWFLFSFFGTNTRRYNQGTMDTCMLVPAVRHYAVDIRIVFGVHVITERVTSCRWDGAEVIRLYSGGQAHASPSSSGTVAKLTLGRKMSKERRIPSQHACPIYFAADFASALISICSVPIQIFSISRKEDRSQETGLTLVRPLSACWSTTNVSTQTRTTIMRKPRESVPHIRASHICKCGTWHFPFPFTHTNLQWAPPPPLV